MNEALGFGDVVKDFTEQRKLCDTILNLMDVTDKDDYVVNIGDWSMIVYDEVGFNSDCDYNRVQITMEEDSMTLQYIELDDLTKGKGICTAIIYELIDYCISNKLTFCVCRAVEITQHIINKWVQNNPEKVIQCSTAVDPDGYVSFEVILGVS